MLFEPYIEKLESLAQMPELSGELLDSALATFAVNPVRPYQILAITFTNKAAGEIKERLEKALGEQALDIWAGTFHSSAPSFFGCISTGSALKKALPFTIPMIKSGL